MKKLAIFGILLVSMTAVSCKKDSVCGDPNANNYKADKDAKVMVDNSLCTYDAEVAASPSLYTRLGGINAISLVTDKFLEFVVGDDRINGQFAATIQNSYRVTVLRNNLIDQICQGSGGPCQYKGETMLAAHAGLGITDAEFDALVEDLVAALTFYNVEAAEINDLAAILLPMRADIVE